MCGAPVAHTVMTEVWSDRMLVTMTRPSPPQCIMSATQVMAVGADSVRVADVVYGSVVSVVFSLDDYVTGNDVSNALEATPKCEQLLLL